MTDTSEPVEPAEPNAPHTPSKLDPMLQERLDGRNAGHAVADSDGDSDTEESETEQLEVIIALMAPPTSDDIDVMAERGLTVRSAIGDILTGVVAIDAVEHLSTYDAILKIESSTTLGVEQTPDVLPDDGFDVADFIE